MKLGILGGTFNPIHIGHLIIAEEVYNAHNLTKVIFMPVNLPPHKHVKNIVDPIHRYQMVQEAIKGVNHFEVSDIEINRNGKSFTIDTVKSILESYNNNCEIYLIMGADSLNELNTWKGIKLLSEMCKIVVIDRPGYNTEAIDEKKINLNKNVVSDIRKRIVHIPLVGISSTEIRNRLKKGYSIRYWTPLSVEKYIKRHGLYV